MRSDQQTVRRSGGALLVEQLLAEGLHRGFCVPGESYLPVLDALREVRDQFDLVTCRHEATAAHMAEASGKLSGCPGVCFVTRGPGAMQAAVGVHTAAQDSTPMILFVGQVPTTHRGREAFQEIDYEAVFGTVAKWVVEIARPERIPELVSRACRVAITGRPGPVVVALPEDVLWAETDAALWHTPTIRPPRPDTLDLDELGELIDASRRPIAIIGGPNWDPETKAELERLAQSSGLPVATSFRRQDYFDNRHPRYVGHVGIPWNTRLARRIGESDLVLAIGTRLDSMTTRDDSLLVGAEEGPDLVHVHPDPHLPGTSVPVGLPIATTAPSFVTQLGALLPSAPRSEWCAWADAGRADHDEWTMLGPADDQVNLAEVVRTVRRLTDDDTVFTNGAGNYTGWLHRYMEFRDHGTQAAPLSGSMGYGIPAAIAACLTRPDARAVAFAGDGCFQMAAHELATAVARGLKPVIVLVNNSMFGTIRMHQDRQYPGRPYATSLDNPDFVALAQAHGAHAERVATTAEFEGAFQRALGSGRAAVVEITVPADQRSSPPPWPDPESGP